MDASYTSTRSITQATRLSILKLQNRMADAQKELASGRYADVGITLGAKTGISVSLRQQISRLAVIEDTNSTANLRLDSTLAAQKDFSETAQNFISLLITARDTTTGAAVAESTAKANLASLIDGLNASVGGEYMFAGINSGTKPVANYYGSPPPEIKTAVDTVVQGFLATQPDPSNISAQAIQDFLAEGSDFDKLFQLRDPANPDAPSWANWSSATDQNVTSRISISETLETSSNANFQGYRKLAEAYTMVAEIGVQNLSQSAFEAVANKAMSLAGEAVQDMAEEQSRLGTVQGRITSANTRMAAQSTILTNRINAMETVDPYDAATRVTTLETQLQTAYALTARIQKLSILNYL
jgi:flagellar hook-associated protein 3 FlgL